ncbi:MAG: hypothetical protein Q4D54_06330 [Eubacteriales bacterium]|nr:hypothetical protein [Eubacteriales bacterium]
MSDFYVNTSILKEKGHQIQNIGKVVLSVIKDIESIKCELKSVSINVDGSLDSIVQNLRNREKELVVMGQVAEVSAKMYKNAELTVGSSVGANEIPVSEPTDATPGDEDTSSEDDFVNGCQYTYSDDNIQVPISIEFLDKENCMAMAERIMEEHGQDGKCNGMTVRRMAKEIYAHALGYYFATDLQSLGIDNDFLQGMAESGVVADLGLGDGLDVHYNILWYWMDPFDLGATYF